MGEMIINTPASRPSTPTTRRKSLSFINEPSAKIFTPSPEADGDSESSEESAEKSRSSDPSPPAESDVPLVKSDAYTKIKPAIILSRTDKK